MSKSPITTHALDTATGRPASGLPLALSQQQADGSWAVIAEGVTNSDGRVADLLTPGSLTPGVYQMRFETGVYHQNQGVEGFYLEAVICFVIKNTDEHYHIPLLLSPFGYSTYRGS